MKHFPDPPARLHFIGLKGVAMTALAQILQGQGYAVSGSDTAEAFITDAVLKRLAIYCREEFAESNINEHVAAVVYSTAYGPDHIERRAAAARGILEFSYPEVIGIIMHLYKHSIAVAGSHGKTTTTALVARMLEEGGCDPTAIVGSKVVEWGTNARLGTSDWFVVEADEYQNKFQYYAPRHLVVTNVDYDHPDYFPSSAAYEQIFLDFASKLPSDGTLLVLGTEPILERLRKVCRAKIITYGFAPDDEWRLDRVIVEESGTSFAVSRSDIFFGSFSTSLLGQHYALDAVAAMAVAAGIGGVGSDALRRALKYFRGTARRLEQRGEYNGALVYDDYAHHPTEIAATLQALRARYASKRIWCVFQSHTYTRTAKFIVQFAEALNLADRAIIVPIYASARESRGKISHEALAAAVNRGGGSRAEAVSSLAEATEHLRKEIGVDDVVVTMGAGDVWRVAEQLVVNRP